MLTDHQRRYITLACRIVVAGLFIFSGFAKAIDPWGTSFVVEEYLRAYAMGWLGEWSIQLSIVLSGFELLLGIVLLANILSRITSFVAMVVLSLFTIVTLLSATVFTIADCGCFGEVLKLSPWLTFAKNIALLPFAIALWWLCHHKGWSQLSGREIIYTLLAMVVSFGIGVYSYLYLPLIDLTPYREGVNLYELVYGSEESGDEAEDTYIYKHTESGELREFTLAELESVVDDRWEWVEILDHETEEPEESAAGNFFIADSEGDATYDILSRQGSVYMICITDFDALTTACEKRLERVVSRAMNDNDMVIILTPEHRRGITYHSFADSSLVRCYNIDARTMKNLLRAENGLVILENGIIREKYNCRSIDF